MHPVLYTQCLLLFRSGDSHPAAMHSVFLFKTSESFLVIRMRDQESRSKGEAVSRRRFAGSALAVAASSLLPMTAASEEPRAEKPTADLGPKPEDLSSADWNEVGARFSNLMRVYGERLSIEQQRHAIRILTTNQHMLASIRNFAVQNGDPSACTLRVYQPSSKPA